MIERLDFSRDRSSMGNNKRKIVAGRIFTEKERIDKLLIELEGIQSVEVRARSLKSLKKWTKQLYKFYLEYFYINHIKSKT